MSHTQQELLRKLADIHLVLGVLSRRELGDELGRQLRRQVVERWLVRPRAQGGVVRDDCPPQRCDAAEAGREFVVSFGGGGEDPLVGGLAPVLASLANTANTALRLIQLILELIILANTANKAAVLAPVLALS